MNARIAVTGLGCICAQGSNGPEIMDALYGTPKPPEPPSTFATPLADFPVFEVHHLPERFRGKPLDADRLTRSVRMAAAALDEALASAGIAPEALRGRRTAILMGTTVGVTLSDAPYYRAYAMGGGPRTGPYERFLQSNPSLALAELLELRALPFTVVNACASSTDAIGLGSDLLRTGLADLVLAGGADEVGEVNHTGFSSLLIYSKSRCRPFDAHRDGLNLGSGAAVLVMERERDARRRGVEPEYYLTGYGTAADGYHLTAPHPEGRGLRRAIEEALRESGIGPESLAFVNAHGTATRDNDQVEGRVLSQMLLPGTPVISTKGYTGHTLGAAGAVEAAVSLWAMRRDRLMPSAGFQVFDTECGITPSAGIRPLAGSHFLSTSLGFGGVNAALVFMRERR